MTSEEAKSFLIAISYDLGNMTIEYLTEKAGEKMREAIKSLEQQPKTIQEKQAESEKYEKAFDDGYKNGYAQARFDYEQQPCEDCISRNELLSRIDAERKHLLSLKMDGAEHILVHHARRIIEDMPSVTPTYDLEEYSTKLWKLAYERGKAESEGKE